MSRIRSTHPGLWTDEAFVTLSPFARLFFMGLWNECDDFGSFEWAPLKLKMRLAPADNVDGATLLTEIEAAACIMAYEVAGKRYGAVRNFCQYQRPKKPTSVHPQTEAVRQWVNTEARSTRDGSEVVGKELPTDGEKSRQRKEGGGSGSSVAKATAQIVPIADPEKVMFDQGIRYLATCGVSEGRARSQIGKWKRHGSGAVIEALGAAQRLGITDPMGWIEARFHTIAAQDERPRVPL